MKKGILIFGIFLMLVLLNLVSAANCGGAVQCNCGDTLTSSQTMWYDLTNCSGNGLVIGNSGITLDCNGHLIDGDEEYILLDSGIYLSGRKRVAIKNCNVREFHFGISLSSSSNNTLTNITANSNYYGIWLWSSSNNTLTNITANSNSHGIHLSLSSNNTLTGIKTNSNSFGIYLDSSSNNNILTSITASSNGFIGIYLDSSSNNNILTSITVSSNNYYGIYLDSSSKNILTNITASSNGFYGIYLDSSSNNTLTNITANNNNNGNGHGISLSSSSNNTLTNITAKGNGDGIYLYSSSNNIVSSSTLSENNHFDFSISTNSAAYCNNQLINVTGSNNKAIGYYSSSVSVSGQEFSELILCNADYSSFININISASTSKKNNGLLVLRTDNSNFSNINSSHSFGISLSSSSNNTLTNITANSNSYGISLDLSSNNTLTSITASSNGFIGIYLDSSSNNTLTNITTKGNENGIYLYSSSNNKVYLNNFINNTKNAYSSNSINTWNSPKSINYTYNNNKFTSYLGNYWSDYTGSDANGNGVGDSSYNFTVNGGDNFPLMTPFENYFGQVQPSCTDGIKNGNETDIDCGGTKCSKCADFNKCLVNTDCVSSNCRIKNSTIKVCVPKDCWTKSPLSNAELADLVKKYFPEGFVPQTNEDIKVTAYAVAKAETSGNPSACGDYNNPSKGYLSIGLWQINTYFHKEYNVSKLFEPNYNAQAAVNVSKNGKNWNDWCTWEKTACNGQGNNAYRNYLNEARKLFCTDSDNGKNYSVKGTTKGKNSAGTYVERIDSCSSDGKYVNEFYCENNIVKYTAYTCKIGCQNGACKPVCSDSDGGKIYTIKGTTKGKNSAGTYVERIDSCSSDGKYVNEFYCENNIVKYTAYTCSKTCSNGICLK